ncbi:transporter substrate-binding domain-containing protein [Brevibacillus sp. NRS-1366]|uniref:transporter substrate-binding domain-containing protein n=1 Tax=Brevibacillus sp. NRS-1366 TaxID=3233899 RepID=UPI003D25AC05
MRKIALLIVSVIMVLIVIACGNVAKEQKASPSSRLSVEDSQEKTDLEKLKEKGQFVIGTTGAYPPFAYHTDKGNRELTGFDVELLNEVIGKIGLKVSYMETEWEGMLAGLGGGRFDSIHQVTVQDRQEKYDFSDPYLTSYTTLIVLDETADIKSFDDLKGKKVYGSNSSTYGKLAKSKGAELVPEGEFVELLNTKRVDALIFNNLYYLNLKKSRPDLKIKAVDQLKEKEEIALPFVKGNDGTVIAAINQALREIKKDGTYARLTEKWFGQDLTQ